MPDNETITKIEAEIHQLENETNDVPIQKADVLLKRIELLLKLEALKSKELQRKSSDSQKDKRIVSIVSNPLLITIIAGLLTSLIAPYIIDRFREKSALLQQAAQKQDAITKTQFEIIEKLNSILWSYRASAEFLIWDYLDGHVDNKTLAQHIKDYDSNTRTTNKNLNAEMFRAKMYFDDQTIYEKLKELYKALDKLDDEINKQINLQNNPNKTADDYNKKWQEIHELLYEDIEKIETVLSELFAEVGRPQPLK